ETSTMRKARPNKTSKITTNKEKNGHLNRSKMHIVEDKSSYDKTSKVTTNNGKKGPMNQSKMHIVEEESSDDEAFKVIKNKEKKEQTTNKFSSYKAVVNPLKRGQSQILEKYDTEFSSDDPEQVKVVIQNRGLTFNFIEMSKTQDITSDKTKVREPSLSEDIALNISRISETQETTALTNRTKTHKPNDKSTKKGISVDHNALNEINSATDISESEPSLSDENIGSALNTSEILETQDTITCRTKQCKPNDRTHIDRNVYIEDNKSELSLSDENIARNISKIPKTQDAIVLRTKTRKPNGTKKGNHIDHNVPNVEPKENIKSARNINKIPETQDSTIALRTKAHKLNGTKERNRIDHNVPIDVNESEPKKNIKSARNISKIPETQDTTIALRTKARKLNSTKKGKHVNHNVLNEINSAIDVNESEPKENI
ncbi:1594_t:CDS:2, partial [Gigaspora rosea]